MEDFTYKIGIIIILYYPDKEHLIGTISKLPENEDIILVDNTPKQDLHLSNNNVKYIALKENRGIAFAQNIAINELRKKKCNYVVFFDQDSNILPNYPRMITKEHKRISQFEKKLFLLGPKVINRTDKKEYSSIFHKDIQKNYNFINKREIISSGSCTTLPLIDKVGLLYEELFIDYVDFEWCWRAKSKQLVCGITPNVVLEHKVGNKEIYLWKYTIIISAPLRYFYQYRNYFYLIRKKYVPFQWKVAMAIKMGLRLFYFPLLIKDGKKCWTNMIKGIKCGLKI